MELWSFQLNNNSTSWSVYVHVFCLVSILEKANALEQKINRTQTYIILSMKRFVLILLNSTYTLPLKFKVCGSFHSLFFHVFFHSTREAFAAYNLGVLSLNSSNNSEESTCSIEAYLGWRFVWDFVGWFWFSGIGDCESLQILIWRSVFLFWCFLWLWDVDSLQFPNKTSC